MIQVAILTQEQYEQVHLKQLAQGHAFYCAKDANDNWTVEKTQIEQIENEEFLWLKQLPLVEFEIPVIEQSTTGSL
jgi:hypothetical protein